jgi:hypothetical protein
MDMDKRTIYIAVDTDFDLRQARNPAYMALAYIDEYHTLYSPEDSTLVNGISVRNDKAEDALNNYLDAWDSSWLEVAKGLGYDAIAGRGQVANRQLRKNDPSILLCHDGEIPATVVAWQHVWDNCPTVKFTEDMIPGD